MFHPAVWKELVHCSRHIEHRAVRAQFGAPRNRTSTRKLVSCIAEDDNHFRWLRSKVLVRVTLRINVEKIMATAEQVQEALQQLLAQGARIAELETQLQIESARAQTAEHEKSALIQTLVTIRQERAGSMVETKGIGQHFTLKGGTEQDFGEWTHKVRTFMLAKFGHQILGALTWAPRQRKMVVKACGPSQKDRLITWIDVFGEGADEDRRDRRDRRFRWKTPRILCLHYNQRIATGIVRNAGEGNDLEPWRRPHSEYDPTSSMRRVAILQQVQIPPRCQRVEDLGICS